MLQVNNLKKTFPGGRASKDTRVTAVDDVSLTVEPGHLYTLLGPSGCGKTTTLRCVAGLEHPDSGEIRLDDRMFFSSKERVQLRASERGLGMVFQSYAIWPHMNVFKNVAFPLKVKPRRLRPSKRQIQENVERVLNVVQLGHLAQREATDLSGGQQQRLALARALIMEPSLMLLDEPLSNLDAKLREEMRFELKRLQRDLNITSVYVTHDQVEALALSNVIAVMRDGKIEQVGKPREIYQQPASKFVADFVGTSNFIDGTVDSQEASDRYVVSTGVGKLRATSSGNFTSGQKVVVVVRPEHISISRGTPSMDSIGEWSGTVSTSAFLGESVDHVVSVGSINIRARSNPSVSIPPGTDVTLSFPDDMSPIIADE